MSKSLSVKRALMVATIFFMLTIIGCTTRSERSVIFQNVTAKSKWDNDSELLRKYHQNQEIPEYLVMNEKLFLPIQITQSKLLYVEVTHVEWSAKKISELLLKAPALKRFLPNPTASGGGIAWIAAGH